MGTDSIPDPTPIVTFSFGPLGPADFSVFWQDMKKTANAKKKVIPKIVPDTILCFILIIAIYPLQNKN
ncbi:MAG: hypothetical protein NT178_17395 [Proteobacteria bacterium]|nr:hypothetical protein [Pseudomonadota bacterium]